MAALFRKQRRASGMGEQESGPAPACPKPSVPVCPKSHPKSCLQCTCRVFSRSEQSPCLPVEKESPNLTGLPLHSKGRITYSASICSAIIIKPEEHNLRTTVRKVLRKAKALCACFECGPVPLAARDWQLLCCPLLQLGN